MKTYNIQISAVMQNRTYPEAGNALYNIIESKAGSYDRFVLDLQNVELVPSMFLNTSIGKLYADNGLDYIKQKIAFKNVSVSQMERIRNYVNGLK